jgi:phi13 family phage major tail protein
MTTKKPLIGLDNFYYALLNSDTTAGVSYQTPTALKGAITVSYNPNSEVSTLFADDGPYDTAESIGEVELEVGIADISQEDYAAIMGHTITGGVMDVSASDQPVDVAFGFRAKRSNSGYSYFWFLKGKFSKPSMDHETKGDKISWQTPKMTGKFVQRIYDGLYEKTTRNDATDYTDGIGTAWFTTVYGTTADTTAPTLTGSNPSAGMTTCTQTVYNSSLITLLFSEPLLTSTLTMDNIIVSMRTATSTLSGTFTYSTSDDTAIVSFILSAQLTAISTYDVIVGKGIRDLAGNKLSAAATFYFTMSA